MAITLCSLPVNILVIILLIIGRLDLEFHKVHILIFEEIDSLPRRQVLDKPSMSTKSYIIVVSYQLSDTENWSLYSHAVKLNRDLGSVCFALNLNRALLWLATTCSLSNHLFILFNRWDKFVIGELDLCVDSVHKAATVHHA